MTVFEKTTYESEEEAFQEGDVAIASSLYASLFYGAHAQSITPQTVMRVLRAHAHEVDFRRRTRATDLAESETTRKLYMSRAEQYREREPLRVVPNEEARE